MPAATRLSEAIEEYLAVLKAQGMSRGTLSSKKSSLLRFLAVVGNIYPRNLGPQHVDAFLVKHEHWQASTRKVNLAQLSSFQRWLQARKYVDRGTDILEGRRRIKVPKKTKVHIKPDDFDKLLDKATNPRDRIAIAIGLYLLVRESEMVAIQWKHIDLAEGWVEIYRQKTGEPDRLPISAKLHDELARWRAYVGEAQPDWYVVCAIRRAIVRGERGKWLGNIGRMALTPEDPLKHPLRPVKKVLATQGYQGEGIGMHTLRRSGAQALLEALEQGRHDESAIRIVQSMLGHSSIQVTEIYLNRDVDRARRDDLIRGKMLYGEEMDLELDMLDREEQADRDRDWVIDGARAEARV